MILLRLEYGAITSFVYVPGGKMLEKAHPSSPRGAAMVTCLGDSRAPGIRQKTHEMELLLKRWCFAENEALEIQRHRLLTVECVPEQRRLDVFRRRRQGPKDIEVPKKHNKHWFSQ